MPDDRVPGKAAPDTAIQKQQKPRRESPGVMSSPRSMRPPTDSLLTSQRMEHLLTVDALQGFFEGLSDGQTITVALGSTSDASLAERLTRDLAVAAANYGFGITVHEHEDE